MWLLFSASLIKDPVKNIILYTKSLVLVTTLTLLSACSESSNANIPTIKLSADELAVNTKACQGKDTIVSEDGTRRMALILGVGKYKSKKIRNLVGAPEDAKRIYQLLTDKNAFHFPKENVCLLLDENATKEGVIAAFEKRLIEPAKKDDVVFFYYAGHGSQITDQNNDEPDNMDETFVLHDSRTDDILDLIDDEFNLLLTRLYKKTSNIITAIDACHSGSITRGEYVTRFVEPLTLKKVPESKIIVDMAEDSSPKIMASSMPGIVLFTAASDGTSALEYMGRGIFTDALLASLASVSGSPATYQQVARKIPALILAQNSPQIAYFQGDLEKFLFSNQRIKKPFSWDISKVLDPTKKEGIHLSGTPMPGIGIGSELRIFPGNTNKIDSQDLNNSKATLIIDSLNGLNAKGHINTKVKGAKAIQSGDYAVLVSASNDQTSITVSLRTADKKNGIPKSIAQTLKSELNSNVDARKVVHIVKDNGDFELIYKKNKIISIVGPANKIRAQFFSEAKVIHNLWQHARHRALLQLQGEGGQFFTDNNTLQVQLVPSKKQGACSSNDKWQQAAPNAEQIIPLCHKWQIKVTYKESDKKSPKLLIGGVIQSSDGNSFGLPNDGATIALNPGESIIFPRTFVGQLPLDTTDTLIIFGTQEKNPVQWHLLTDINRSATRGLASPLQNKIKQYLTQTRGVGVEESPINIDESTWTMSIVPLKVEANSRFLKPGLNKPLSKFDSREYTIQQFNILPYLPDDEQSPLYRVLQTADQLARSSMSDGYRYTQHDWSQGSDIKNLKKGIDCSRAIWYAFTRSGLKYNKGDRYITTQLMAPNDSIMQDYFKRCDDAPLELGDILVYRDDTRGDGHTVMVIDPKKRIAWGSHGWDGSGKALKIEPDTGVEYQLIKYKKDWKRWDRKTMFRKACWRYKDFIPETMVERSLDQPETRGYQALKNYCQSKKCQL